LPNHTLPKKEGGDYKEHREIRQPFRESVPDTEKEEMRREVKKKKKIVR